MRRRVGGLWLALVLLFAVRVEAAPRRVVSLNPCLDAILLEVAAPGQIAALSRYSRDPSQSAVAAQARRFPFTWGSAEAVAALHPDLVLIGGWGGVGLTPVLARLHIASASFGEPRTIAESLGQVRQVAALVGHADRGEAMAARIEAAVQASAPLRGERRLSALLYESDGLATGPDTLMSELMADAGLDNVATRYGLRHSGEVPLERLVAAPPQVLLAGSLAPGEPSWADRVLSHPVLRAIGPRMRREPFPETLFYCAGPVLIPAAAALSRARRDAQAHRP